MKNKLFLFTSLLIVALMWITACEGETVEVTRVVSETVVKQETVIVTATPQPPGELESIVNAFYDAYLSQDSKVIAKYLAPLYTAYLSVGAEVGVYGSDIWYNPNAPNMKIAVNEYSWIIAPELALRKSRETWTYPGGGEFPYLFTQIWQKEDGQWRLVHSHMSEMP